MSFRCLNSRWPLRILKQWRKAVEIFQHRPRAGQSRRFRQRGFRLGEAAEVLEERLLLSTIVVDDDGAGDQTTIQDAINAATAGDLILVTGGADHIQTEAGITVNKDLTIEGAGRPTQVVVQAAPTPGTATDRVFDISNGTNVTIDDLTIRNGSTTGDGGGIRNRGTLTLQNSTITQNTSNTDGGGIYNRYASLTVESCTIIQNTTNENPIGVDNEGGGIFADATFLTVRNSTIAENTATKLGGGIYHYGNTGTSTTATITIENTNFSQNSAALGGGLYSLFDQVQITNSAFSQNTASSSGGGVYVYLAINDPKQLAIDGSTFSGNIAEYGGGLRSLASTVNVSNSTFSENTGNQRGGAIYSEAGFLTLTDSTLSQNSSSVGGGIYNDAQGQFYRGNLTISGSTISYNSASTDGGGMHIDSGRLDLENSTISQNSAQNNGGGISTFRPFDMTLTNSTLIGNRADTDGNGGTGGGGILSGATMFSTIVAGNFQGTGNTDSDIVGTLDSASANNLIGDPNSAGGLINGDANHNIVGDGSGGAIDISTVLDPVLRDNGGPTLTHALVPGSPALLTGSNPMDLLFDQRGPGFPREDAAGFTDIGAVETPRLVVDDDGNGDFLTIQGAIDAALDGQLILVTGGANHIQTEAGITVNKDVTIQGIAGPTQIIVQAAPTPGTATDRVFHVAAGTTAEIDNLTIRYGNNFGGGILNDGALTVAGCTITQNASDADGGGIANDGGLFITNSTISQNFAQQNGGGIVDSGNVTITGSTVSFNTALDFGGGISSTGSLAVGNSTFSNNVAGLDGGGIDTFFGNLLVANSTITGNTADASLSGSSFGGGISNIGSSATLISTIAAGNLLGSGTADDISGTIDSADHNLIGDPNSAGGIANGQAGNIVGDGSGGTIDITTVLDPVLSDNGGPTLTHALVLGSPAVDAGSNPFAFTFDQRGPGFEREDVPGFTDIGAVEAQFFVVDDDGNGNFLTIQAAIDAAHTGDFIFVTGGADGIQTEAGITVDKDVTIHGATGGAQVIVQAAPTPGTATDRVFEVTTGTTARIDDLTIRYGNSESGAAIMNAGTLTLTGSTITQNSCGSSMPFLAGAVLNRHILTVESCTISDNPSGGLLDFAIDGFPPQSMTVRNSTISGNDEFGIRKEGGFLLQVINSTISENNGAGIDRVVGQLAIYNSTITGNDEGILDLFQPSSDMATIVSSIVAGNTRDVDTTAIASNSLFGDANSAGGVVNGQNGNIVGNGGQGTIDINTVLDTTLQDNGGPTLTHALVPGSPALDRGSNPLNLSFDQRGPGFERDDIPGFTDMGAVEGQLLFVDDDGNGNFLTIQAAINAAHSADTILVTGGADRIQTEQGITVNQNVTILGLPGTTQVIVQAAATPEMATDRVFDVRSGTVVIDNLTIRYGTLYGAGIRNSGTLALNNSTVTQNSGVGIYNNGGRLTILNSTISQNIARGIFNSLGPLTIEGSTITQNRGSGLLVENVVAINNSMISYNSGTDAAGGIQMGNGVRLTVTNSTISNNFSISSAGGIDAIGTGTLLVANCTISQNSANGYAGGIYNANDTLTVTNSTITGNLADADNDGIGTGGGIYNSGLGTFDLISTVVAGNFVSGKTTASDISGLIDTASNNLIGDAGTSGGIVNGQNGNIVGNDGQGTIDITTVLDPVLRDNGGPTLTHALVPGSPAINAGSNPLGLATDQRGFSRLAGSFPDIGAYEVEFRPRVAAGNGSGPFFAEVEVFDPVTGGQLSIFPYSDLGDFGYFPTGGNFAPSQGFVGGVRVALADVTGDGIDDVITGPGTGGGPRIRVFDGNTGFPVNGFLGDFFAFDPSFFGGVYVAAADLNQDGHADVIVGAGETGGPHVKAYSGKDGSILFDFFAFDPNFRGGVRVAAGDVNQNGTPDIIAAAGPGGGPHVRVFEGSMSIINQVAVNIPGPLGSFFAYEPTYSGGVFVGGVRQAPDGSPLIITGSTLRPGGAEVRLFYANLQNNTGFKLPLFTEVRVAMFDYDGDGINDYLLSSGPGVPAEVRIYSGNRTIDPRLPFGPPLLDAFPFGQNFTGGLYVAGANPAFVG